jgi:hypothetical protein
MVVEAEYGFLIEAAASQYLVRTTYLELVSSRFFFKRTTHETDAQSRVSMLIRTCERSLPARESPPNRGLAHVQTSTRQSGRRPLPTRSPRPNLFPRANSERLAAPAERHTMLASGGGPGWQVRRRTGKEARLCKVARRGRKTAGGGRCCLRMTIPTPVSGQAADGT